MTLPLENIYLQMATPSLDNSYWGEYVAALQHTQQALEHFGATFQWVNYPGCSDLCHARAKILAKFAQHPHATHLLKVDSDIAWEPADVIRMLNSNRDLIAGVGCKKKLPLEYCVGNYSEKDGKLEPCAFKMQGSDLVAYPKSVGTGFMMISKACALRMTQAYPDLMYTDKFDKQEICALYDPVILTNGGFRTRHFDDFAFCHRWRKINGVVSVFPDIHLRHRGHHVFEGKWIQSEEVNNWLKDGLNGQISPQAA